MNDKTLIKWFSVLSVIGMIFGIVYSFFGLGILPVSKDVLVPWGNGVYGSTMIGFFVLLFFVGRLAFRNGDITLMKVMLYSLFSWLIIEASFSIYYEIYFNFAVDAVLMIFFGYPLLKRIQQR
ncbi:MAG: hypothetical protein A3I07_03875 [Candidatus Doudnabacteria bacterium RIFCSPLOWO2_02_FULL_42_9]|uniref:DUF4345 domain-containing protein n=1 Tax=Candidatus Doudnabacteria bacterium RIFCSPHIGHO2_01_FULL_41_86 TaxID=1817821 RepID=A0A1F5N7G6_9BACT|nr:MAG: hypothetical protein A2717_02990 [Candidatus Doudnabacteria bacterium RIFCSPHIGHO2_01_FULL_41_86]OGE74662.1 MAG: hypothetical protein A3K07_02585 [Candidatus Doudnabacteria bacterium RIFCSPHIGHO2_01_43_10]OGE85021.1 MAG: hypothetical protein A3E28_04395 [Candidatus Doudnabacteria bacterium RIFCSPHIGHO2_12_FULL_42_22]OGE86462.1 MAG: hypothetical protein A3C49_04575 [Candidatus Doudnabacteria bacterium RIFCSPHIGHO2_02_FULL_42_25]OGE91924.1 MAG: hypothetical protein A2895_01340 [Candidatus